MFDRVKRLFETSIITNEGVRKAVMRGWFTPEQYEEITGQSYETDTIQ